MQPVQSLMGMIFYYKAIGDVMCLRSEFSLSQHLRTKHPEKADELLGQIMKEGHN